MGVTQSVGYKEQIFFIVWGSWEKFKSVQEQQPNPDLLHPWGWVLLGSLSCGLCSLLQCIDIVAGIKVNLSHRRIRIISFMVEFLTFMCV